MAEEVAYQELIEMKKALNLTEALVEREQKEKMVIVRLHQQLKGLFEKAKKENEELSVRLITAQREKESLKGMFDSKLKEVHEFYKQHRAQADQDNQNQRQIERELIKAKLENQVRAELVAQFSRKSDDNDKLRDDIFEVRKTNERLQGDIAELKRLHKEELERTSEKHRGEAKDLLFEIRMMQEKAENTVSAEKYDQLRQELSKYKTEFNELQSELSFLRRDKEHYLMEKNESKLNLLKEVDQLRMKNKLMEADLEKFKLVSSQLEGELKLMQGRIKDKGEEVNALNTERIGMVGK